MQSLDAASVELDAVLLHQVTQIDLDLLALAPAYGNPGIRRREFEVIGIADKHELVFLAELLAKFVNLRDAADTGAHYDDLGHLFPLNNGSAQEYIIFT